VPQKTYRPPPAGHDPPLVSKGEKARAPSGARSAGREASGQVRAHRLCGNAEGTANPIRSKTKQEGPSLPSGEGRTKWRRFAFVRRWWIKICRWWIKIRRRWTNGLPGRSLDSIGNGGTREMAASPRMIDTRGQTEFGLSILVAVNVRGGALQGVSLQARSLRFSRKSVVQLTGSKCCITAGPFLSRPTLFD